MIREFSFPRDALVRELVPAANSPYLWGADVRRTRSCVSTPHGATEWHRVDFRGSTGPHTIVPDDAGNLWVSMVDNDQFGRFDPRTGQWKLWTLRPSELAESASIGGAAIVHDMSIDSRGHLARDQAGNVWLTLVGTNQMGTLNPDTGRVAFYDTNHLEGLSPINHLIYSTVLSADGQCAWYSQVNGSVGCIDTRTHDIEGWCRSAKARVRVAWRVTTRAACGSRSLAAGRWLPSRCRVASCSPRSTFRIVRLRRTR